jgi:hypothetical protein
MRKLYSTLFALIVLIFSINAQITLNYGTHCLLAGTSHDFVFLNGTTEGKSGPNVVWDFSNLKETDKNLTSHMLKAAGLEKSSQVPKANTVIEEFGNLFYFNVNNDVIEQYGAVYCNTLVVYDKPYLKLKFPLHYGDKTAGEYSGIQESGTSKVAIQGKYEVSADAYGTLILPGNNIVENVLRVKQVRTYGNTDEITYRWYAADVRYPVFVVIKYQTGTSSSISETAMYSNIGSQLKGATAIVEKELVTSFDVYPSPYHEQLTISYNLEKEGKVSIDLYDMSGKKISTLQSGITQNEGYHNLVLGNNENLLPGIYYIRLTHDNKTYMKKVIKQ